MQLIKRLAILIFILPLMAGCAKGLTAFSKGEKLEDQGKLDEAVLKYAEAMSSNPGAGEYRLRFLKTSEKAARIHLEKGEEYLAKGNYDEAVRECQTAYTLDPSMERAFQASDKAMKLRNSRRFYAEGENFEKDHKMRVALASYKKAAELDPDYREAAEAVERLLKSRKSKLDGFDLNLKSTKPITLKFRDAKIKEVFNILSQLSGINFVFDEGVKDQNVSIFLENATFYQALEILTGMNKLGRRVLNESTIIVYTKTPDKEKQYEDLKVQTFLLNKLDAKKAVNLVRTMLPAKKIYVNEDLNALVMRDTPESIEVARRILEANDVPDAELVLEVEIVEISKNNKENFGLVLSRYAVTANTFTPDGQFFSDTFDPKTTDSTQTVTNVTPSNLLELFRWRGFKGFFTVPSATYNFGKNLANGQTLANPRIRVKNREKAKFNVGTRVPITTTSSPTSGGTSVNVQYVDVGVKLNAEPTVQLNDDIEIKLGLEVSSVLSTQTFGDANALATVVTIGTRNLDTVLSLKDGETSIIGGLLQDNRQDSKQKISFLGDIPILGSLLGGKTEDNTKTELILAITPHIVRAVSVPDTDVASFWSGKEDDPSVNNPYGAFEQEPDIPVPQPPAAAPATGDAAAVTPSSAPAAAVAMPTAGPEVNRNPALQSRQPVPPPPAFAPAPPGNGPGAASQPPAGGPPSAAAQNVVPPLPAAGANPATPVPGPPAVPPAGNAKAAMTLTMNYPSSVKVGEQFNVNIVAAEAANLLAAPFELSYDPSLMDYVGSGEGPFLRSDGKATSFQASGMPGSGIVSVTLARNGGVGVNGAGLLATLTFRAKKTGSARFGFARVSFISAEGKPLTVIPFNAVVEVK